VAGGNPENDEEGKLKAPEQLVGFARGRLATQADVALADEANVAQEPVVELGRRLALPPLRDATAQPPLRLDSQPSWKCRAAVALRPSKHNRKAIGFRGISGRPCAHAGRSAIVNAEALPMSEPTARPGRIAMLWRGDEAARRSATPQTSRLKAVFAALADVGVDAEPVVYEDNVLDAVRAQLVTLDGVLVWVNPIHEGRNRANLDALLREVAARGVWVSAHPDVIAKMGTKEVLHSTRTMSWGCDTALYRTFEAMRAEFPARLVAGPRVIKRNRGNGGQGVWKVEILGSPHNRPMVRVLDATKDASEELPLDAFLQRCSEYFEDGCVIDQPFQARLSEGVVRCYMTGDRCAGFGHQKVRALVNAPPARTEAGRRRYTSNADPRFQRLRQLMEDEWTPQLTALLDIPRRDLPMIWDADFMLGPPSADGTDRYVLGEINVSSVFPIPDDAPAEIARCVADRLRSS
jgi:hypothetical protein